MISNLKLKNLSKYIFLHILFILYSTGTIFSKFASQQNFGSFKFFMYYSLVLMILVIYAFFWQKILKKIPVSTAFANKSIIVIWGMIFGRVIFNEKITLNMILGSIIIFLGIFFVVREYE